MDTDLSITEALIINLVDQDNVDATNVVTKLRTAQGLIQNTMGIDTADLHALHSEAYIDDLIIWATRNGAVDIFS